MKKSILVLLLGLVNYCCFSQIIPITEIVVYNDEGKKDLINKNVNNDLVKLLDGYWFNDCVKFERAVNEKTGSVNSTIDAIRVCNMLDCNFVLYGYIKKTSVNFYAEIKLYDKENAKVQKVFFSSDDINNYDRLIQDISIKIRDYFIDLYKIKTEKQLQESLHDLQFDMPASLHYWAPIDKQWSSVLLGIVGMNVGVDFYPEFLILVKNNRKVDFNFRFELGYKYGRGNPDYYPINYNAISVTAPFMLNYHLNNKNTLSLGIGPLYQLILANVQKKYESPSKIIQNEMGLEFIFNYSYALNDKWKLLFELDGDLFFTNRSFAVIKPKIGFIWNFYKKSNGGSYEN